MTDETPMEAATPMRPPDQSRAFAEAFVRDCYNIARYWARQPDVDPASGTVMDTRYKCEGVVFSMLSLMDGCSHGPALDLRIADYHPDDEPEDNEWPAGLVISEMLHEIQEP